MSEDNEIFPLAYLITVRCYGTWLHGDEKGSVDRHGYNIYETPRMFPSNKLKDLMMQELCEETVSLNQKQRETVLLAIKEVCGFRGYELLAINVRTNHIHAVVSAQIKPEKIINEFKSYATRGLREAILIGKDKTVWARGASRRYLWKEKHVQIATDYVLFGQGDEIFSFD